MKCPNPNCGAEIKPGYRFCPKCRTKIGDVTPDAPIMTRSVPNVSNMGSSQPTNNAEVVKHKSIWQLADGELVRHISESEFATLDAITGIIVEQGTTAVVYVDGQMVCALSGGIYNFVSDAQVTMSTRPAKTDERSLWQKIKDGLYTLLHGKKQGDNKPVAANVDDVIRRLTANSIITAYIMRDAEFSLVVGTTSSDKNGVKPLQISTRYMNANVFVHLKLRICDLHSVVREYLGTRKSLSLQTLNDSIKFDIEHILSDELGNCEIEYGKIPANTYQRIEDAIMQLNRYLHGVQIIRVINITADDNDLKRYEELSRQMYLSEKEMDYIKRTNEFKNRLAMMENEQKVTCVRNDFELEKVLTEINKDKLLHEEELRDFLCMLKAQRTIKEARSEYEVSHALLDLRRSKMVDAEEVLKFEEELKQNRFNRSIVTEMMRIDGLERVAQRKRQIEDALIARQQEQELLGKRHETSMLEEEIHQHVLSDRYTDSRNEYNMDLERRYTEQQQNLDHRAEQLHIDTLERKQNMSIRGLTDLAKLDQELKDAQHRREMESQELARRHEMNLANLQHEERMAAQEQEFQLGMQQSDNYSRMSAEQIMATQASALDSNAQNTLAGTMNSGRENAFLREQMTRDELRRREDYMRERDMMDRMERMMGRMQDMTSFQMQQAAMYERQKADDLRETKNEYREQMMHEQERIDENQRQALNYTTRPDIERVPSAEVNNTENKK